MPPRPGAESPRGYQGGCAYATTVDAGHLIRRTVHLCGPVLLVYYLFPSTWWGIDKRWLLLAGVAGVLLFELARLVRHWQFAGLRGYERTQMAAYAWAALGFGLTFPLFPLHLVGPALIGLAWVDPLIGELRARPRLRELYPILPGIVYLDLALWSLALWSPYGYWEIVLLAGIATVVALLAERPRLRHVDDDFLMYVLPVLALWAGAELLGVAEGVA